VSNDIAFYSTPLHMTFKFTLLGNVDEILILVGQNFYVFKFF